MDLSHAEGIRNLFLLALKLKLRVMQYSELPDHAYTPGVIHIRYGDYTTLAHEIGHWVCADPPRRELKDFGLGKGTDAKKRSKRVVDKLEAEGEEKRASAWGIALERQLGLPWKQSLVDQEWTQSDWKSYVRTVLAPKGLAIGLKPAISGKKVKI